MLYVVIAIGFIFAYINGMHDGGTVIATAISSRLISPKKAVVIAGFANMLGSLIMGTAVSETIFSGIIDIRSIGQQDQNACYAFVLSSFLATIAWNYFTWRVKLPSSASHSMIGAMIGCGLIAYGIESVMWRTIIFKVILAMFLSPVLGFLIGFLLYRIIKRIMLNATTAWTPAVLALHCISSFFLALSYGGNDSQKVAGLICIAVLFGDGRGYHMPITIMISVGVCLSVGTATGGYNMIKTVGFGITKVNMHNSCASQVSTVIILIVSNLTGLPISATQVVSASIMGVGTADTPKAVNWSVTKRTALAWLITIPASAATGAAIFKCLSLLVQLI